MNLHGNRKAFSLTEILIAVGTLAIGMIFIAGIFPAGILFTSRATENTVAAEVSAEAFAKINIFSGSLNLSAKNFETDKLTPFADVSIAPNEYSYPSTDQVAPGLKQYWWSALCRRLSSNSNAVQVTVFIYRCSQSRYNPSTGYNLPVPTGTIRVSPVESYTNELNVVNPDDIPLISSGNIIVDDATGRMYRVLNRNVDIVTLNRNWLGTETADVRTADSQGKCRCIGVYQRILRF